MIYTSHYGHLSKAPFPIAISVGVPNHFDGRIYTKLAPTWKLEDAYRNGRIDEDQYTADYLQLLIQRGLTPKEVLQDLPFRCTLMCWEKPYQFCHRHIVAQWIRENTGIEVKEYGTQFIGSGLGVKTRFGRRWR